MVTHDLDTLHATANRIAVLVDRTIKVGTIDSLMHDFQPLDPRIFQWHPRPRCAGEVVGGLQVETRANYVAVGAFVLVVLAGILVATLWLARVQFQTEYTNYETDVAGPVTGLGSGALVRLNGIEVGRVIRMELDPKNPQLVRLILQVRTAVEIRADAVASLETLGLTGVSYVEISAAQSIRRSLRWPPGSNTRRLLLALRRCSRSSTTRQNLWPASS